MEKYVFSIFIHGYSLFIRIQLQKNSKIQKIQKIQKFENSKIRKFENSKIRKLENSKIRKFENSKIWNHKILDNFEKIENIKIF